MNFFKKKLNKTAEDQKDNFINPKILEVNLIKDEVGIDFDFNKHLLSLFITIIVATMLVTEIYYGLDWWQKQEEQKTIAINTEYEDVSRQIKNVGANSKDFVIFKDKLSLTTKMADNHVYFTNFFDWLEKNTLNSVSYDGFSGDLTGIYALSASAKTFSDISWQVKTLRDNKFVNSVSVDSGTSGRSDDKAQIKATSSPASAVSFSLDLEVKPEIFYRQAE